jgi:hypothetical protein
VDQIAVAKKEMVRGAAVLVLVLVAAGCVVGKFADSVSIKSIISTIKTCVS